MRFLLPDGHDQLESLKHAIVAQGQFVYAGPRQFDEHIFDTADFALFRRGQACCLRESLAQGELSLVGIDALGRPQTQTPPLQQAWPQPAVPAMFSAQQWPAGEVREQVLSLVGATPLVRQGRLRTVRQIYASPDQPALPVLWLDRAVVLDASSNEVRERFLSVSYLRGAAPDAEFERLHRHLLSAFALRPLMQGMYSRCLRVSGRLLHLYQARCFRSLASAETYAQLLERFTGNQLALLQYWRDVAAEGVDPRGVHQMRVAIRRIRSALRTSRDYLEAGTYDQLQAELRWLGQRLGAVRELDVLMGWLQTEPFSDQAGDMAAYWEADLRLLREQAQRTLASALAGERVAGLEERLTAALTQDARLAKKSRTHAPGKIATRIIRKTVKQTAQATRELDGDCPPEALHALRIEYKRLRYTLDFLASAGGAEPRQLRKTCKKVQKILGRHQDLHDRAERIRRYAGSPAAMAHGQEFVFFLGGLFQSQMQAMQACREAFFASREHFLTQLQDALSD
ncbi:CHAD domain-containing protein [Granulosicoccaceae sp. 1_MG-2023]|nr:CHAD domain-containing protein [Granulosicoccaceae sp. 1_MG-2023]